MALPRCTFLRTYRRFGPNPALARLVIRSAARGEEGWPRGVSFGRLGRPGVGELIAEEYDRPGEITSPLMRMRRRAAQEECGTI